MKAFTVLFAVVAAASAGVIAPTTLIRTPSFDSAVIKSDRLGGNFAYSSVEGHAYAAVTPVIQNVIQPVGESFSIQPHYYPTVVPSGAFYPPPLAAYIPGEASVFPAPVAPISPIAPVVPGVVSSSGFGGFIPTDFFSGIIPTEPQKEEEKPAEPSVEAPAEVAAAEPAPEVAPADPQPAEESAQSDDSVFVDSN